MPSPTGRQRIASGSPYEPVVGFSRALRVGDRVLVAGAAPEHVVRTRMFLVDPADWEAVGRAHGAIFAELRPTATMVVVAGLLDPRWRGGIEAGARLDPTG